MKLLPIMSRGLDLKKMNQWAKLFCKLPKSEMNKLWLNIPPFRLVPVGKNWTAGFFKKKNNRNQPYLALSHRKRCEGMYEYKVSNVNTKNVISVSVILIWNNIAFTKRCTAGEAISYAAIILAGVTVFRISRLEVL